ncbi:hypothetical protein GDO81_013509 [Engystomops pustulosus]|uniref:Uncharacterized protein n=1 Tax=Engystomops pustulosus TaxID=76066 RepID=A0AAV7B312_ENGPU|nr:hypothetical protein GDO81_013509 [Engystomops pustulosus]
MRAIGHCAFKINHRTLYTLWPQLPIVKAMGARRITNISIVPAKNIRNVVLFLKLRPISCLAALLSRDCHSTASVRISNKPLDGEAAHISLA